MSEDVVECCCEILCRNSSSAADPVLQHESVQGKIRRPKPANAGWLTAREMWSSTVRCTAPPVFASPTGIDNIGASRLVVRTPLSLWAVRHGDGLRAFDEDERGVCDKRHTGSPRQSILEHADVRPIAVDGQFRDASLSLGLQ